MQRTLSRSTLSRAVFAFTGLSAAAAAAQTEPVPAEPTVGGAEVAAAAPASLGKMRLSLDIVPAPFGKLKASLGGQETSVDAAFAFGVRAALDFSLNEYFFVGFGPQAIFNVKGKDSKGKADKQFDLSLRVGGHAPIADNLHLYGFLSPGYSIMTSGEDGVDSAKGFSLGVAVGALFSVPGTNFFLNGELGYHMTFLSLSELGQSIDVKSNYPLVVLGGGVKL